MRVEKIKKKKIFNMNNQFYETSVLVIIVSIIRQIKFGKFQNDKSKLIMLKELRNIFSKTENIFSP
jgi:hypothetical protein